MTASRFCFFTTFYPPYNFGGDGIAVQRLARALVARGSTVTVIHDIDAFRALNRGGDPVPAGPEPGLETIGLRSRLGRLSLLLTHQTGRPVVHSRRIRRVLREGRFDVVAFHNVSLLGGPGLFSYGGNVRKIYMAHEHWLVCQSHTLWRHNREVCTGRQCVRCALHYRRPPQLWRWTKYLDRQARHVDAFVALSEFSRQKHREFGFSQPMELLPQFLPPPERATSEAAPYPRPYFLVAGRIERMKGLDDVVSSFERYAQADLLIAGDGDYGATLKERAAGNPRVVFLGRVDRATLDRYYRHAIAAIVPSVGYETFGLTAIEAFQHHTPVLARNVGPLPEIIEQSGGGEMFHTADDLIAAMARLQAQPAYRSTMGAAAFRAYQARYTDEVVVPRFLELAACARS